MKAITLAAMLLFSLLTPHSPKSQVTQFTLDNGLKVIVSENPNAPVATFQIYYRTGARNEETGKTGMSHYLEHMMFKGTNSHQPLEFLRTTMREGGISNASTTADYTLYWQDIPHDKIATSIDMEADRMKNLLLCDKEAETEKKVVKEERRKRIQDNPRNALFETFTATAYRTHPYGRPVIGTMRDIDAIKTTDLKDYYRKNYSPDKAFIVIAGNVNPGQIIERIAKAFGHIKPTRQTMTTIPQEPPQTAERRTTLAREAELPYIIIGYHVPNMQNPDSHALQVLNTIMSEGKSSRLYRSLVTEKRLALETGAQYNATTVDPTMMNIWATAMAGTATKQLERAIHDEIERMRKTPPTQEELQRAKNQIAASFIFNQDSPHAEAAQIALFEIAGDWHLMKDYIQKINDVTADDIRHVAAKYLTKQNRTVAILTPIKKTHQPRRNNEQKSKSDKPPSATPTDHVTTSSD